MEKTSAIAQALYTSRRCPGVSLRTTRHSDHPYAPHFHDAASLGIVFEGETVLAAAGEETLVAAGEMVCIAPFEVHSCNPRPGGFRSYHMYYFDREWLHTVLGAGAFRPTQRLIRNRRAYAEAMRIAEAFRQDEADARDGETLAAILREYGRAVPAATGEGRLAGTARRKVCREWFIRSFSREKGIAPGRYRQCLRLARAMRMLREGCDIARTATTCGFSDQSHLHRMCVKYLSATPRQLQGTSAGS